MNIVIAGGTGFIGSLLVRRLLEDGHKLTLLTRHPETKTRHHNSVRYEKWDAKTVGSWVACLEEADAVVNLAGESIAEKRWSPEQKKKIVESRLNATHALVSACRNVTSMPQVLVNASAVGYYGNVPEGEVTAESAKGKGFLADTCEKWEGAAMEASALGMRVAVARIGIVLGEEGGALRKMVPPFRFFAGGPLGSGKQWFPWVHRVDVVGMIAFAIHHSDVSGPFNATAPEPVRMKDFCRHLAKVLNRPSWAPVPAFALKILLGEMSEMLLTGQYATPARMKRWGYTFQYETAEEALKDILGRPDESA